MFDPKKLSLGLLAFFIFGQVAQSQPVSDRGVVPVAVTLNQILRLNIVSGGNHEFVFNTIDDYETGIGGSAQGPVGPPAGKTAEFYETEITIASSTTWELYYGAEKSGLQPTDDPSLPNMSLDHVGWTAKANGTHVCDASGAPDNVLDCSNWISTGTTPKALDQYPSLHTGNDGGNAGDVDDNQILIDWEVGTTPGGSSDMNPNSLLDENLEPDRYVTNVLFDLRQE